MRSTSSKKRLPIVTAALCLPPVIAAFTARETAHVETEHLGERSDEATPKAGMPVQV